MANSIFHDYFLLFIKLSHRITIEVFLVQDKISFFKLCFGFFLVNYRKKNSILSGQKKPRVITVDNTFCDLHNSYLWYKWVI
jgi:hypothetical protein